MAKVSRREMKAKRKQRGRLKINGIPSRPRLSVFRSAKHIYAQVIDDTVGKTLAAVHSFKKGRANIDICREMGKEIAEKCKGVNVEAIVFDKNGCAYHGRVKAFAEGAREGGLKF